MTDTAPARAALVTGGARRIGRTVALALAEAGWDVAVHARDADDARETLAAIEALGRRAVVVTADLEDDAATVGLIPAAAEALGSLNLLVNNASVFEDDRVGSLDSALWDRQMAVNLRAPVRLAEAFAEQAPEGACVVNILDQRVLKPDPRFFSYALSKGGLWQATRMLAQALGPRVRVNGVGPGPTLPSVHQKPGEFEAEQAATLLGRGATPEAVAEAVLYLARADRVTGQMIAVDGGQHLAWRTPDIVD